LTFSVVVIPNLPAAGPVARLWRTVVRDLLFAFFANHLLVIPIASDKREQQIPRRDDCLPAGSSG
jgi:hypothetical protein